VGPQLLADVPVRGMEEAHGELSVDS
jgi:hypothetical protein